VGRVVVCVGAPFVSAIGGRRSDISMACSVRVFLAKRQEWRGEGLWLLLDVSVMRHGAGGGERGVGISNRQLMLVAITAVSCSRPRRQCHLLRLIPLVRRCCDTAIITIQTRRADTIGLR